MSEHGDDSPDADDRGVEEEEEFESEHTATRAEAAAVLRGLADGVDAGAVSIGTGEDALTAAIPDEFGFELEYERDDDEAEIEVELEWAPEDEPSEDRAATAGEPPEGGEPDGERVPVVETATVGSGGAGGDETAGSDGDAEPTATVEAAAPVASRARFEVFRDRADEWRWRLVHRNGNVIASSGEGYTRRHNAEKGLQSVMRNAPDAEVVDEN